MADSYPQGMTIEPGVIANVILRLLLLGAIIFLAMTYIPQTELPFDSKLTISIIVVIIYSLIDFIGRLLYSIRRVLCNFLCGCSDGYVYDYSSQ
jgi:hypothetical protein